MRRVELREGGFGLDVKRVPGKGLSGRFLFPPFSVLNTGEGRWRRRKKQWLALGIRGEVGRSARSYTIPEEWMIDKIGGTRGNKDGISVFDPVLCELMYSWFCPEGGQVVDPFAGGSVRGIVAVCMGLKYWGCELRPEQVEANIEQGRQITPEHPPVWICGDSRFELEGAPEADFIFSCPPYGNLEVYSDLEGDLSNMEYEEFLVAYNRIVELSCRKLREDRFACFVVANFRDEKGFYHDLVGDTVRAFERAGLGYYNELILVSPAGTLPIRVGKYFEVGRKVGKRHQNVLVFYKGDPRRIRELFSGRRRPC